ncbi:COG1361 S-layer family protein [Thermoplasma acidophilum]|uniref:COG1361 S-layer family protein n=1 Tax=Thermoplasma acidophilum TaxID=2303 RepID=UPI00064F652E|nr:COG1361 S-layer family protein [Thermoplasma acidophilum]
MKIKFLLAMLFSSIVIISGLAGISVASGSQASPQVVSVSWFTPNSTEPVAPGMSNVPLIVSFVSPLTLLDASVYVNLTKYNPSILNYVNLHGYPAGPTVYNFTEIPAGERITVMQLVNVSASAATGGYREDLYVQGINASALNTWNVSFTAYILGSTQISVAASYFGTASSPIAASPGMKNIPMTVVLENIGNVIDQNVSVGYTPSYPFYGSPQYFNISAIPPDETVPITLSVSIFSNASDGFYIQNISTSVYGKKSLVQFKPGITGYTNITLVNTELNPPVVYTNEKFIEFKAFVEVAGNSISRYLNVSVSSSDFADMTGEYHLSYVSSGLYNFTFLLNSMSSSGPQTISVLINGMAFPVIVYVHNQTYTAISFHESVLQPGVDKSVLSFNITNDGNTTMYDIRAYLMLPGIITIHVPSSNPLGALTADNITIPSLKPGQTYDLIFLVDTSSAAAPGNYPIELFLGWHYNNTPYQFTKTFDTNVTVSPTVEQKITQAFTFTPVTIAVLVVIAAVIIGLGIYAGVRRKKR